MTGHGLVAGVDRIAVLRANAVGDCMFALPALAALRAAYPRAHVTLLGRRWHRDFLQGRPGSVDEVIALPPIRGVSVEPDAAQDEAEIDACVRALRQRRFDLAVQLHGGGRHSNPFVRRLGARVAIGQHAHGVEPLDRSIDHCSWRNERLALLEVVGLAGAVPRGPCPRLPVTEADVAALQASVRLPVDRPLVVLQPGATDSRRRWPAGRFAAVGDALAAEGACIAINGTAEEAGLTAAVAQAMRAPALDLAGRLSLSALAALLARARLLVSNDTGPLHLAEALGTRTVGIYWLLNLFISAPLQAQPHRSAFSTRLHCPVCGEENVHRRCAHDACFVADVDTAEVITLARAALAEAVAPAAPAGSAPR